MAGRIGFHAGNFSFYAKKAVPMPKYHAAVPPKAGNKVLCILQECTDWASFCYFPDFMETLANTAMSPFMKSKMRRHFI
jgi:hypothetical protein